MNQLVSILSFLVMISGPCLVSASRGDRSNIHQDCLQQCYKNNKCDKELPDTTSLVHPKFNLLLWDCKSECDYSCMWSTVNVFQINGIRIPQFYGKWPFARLLGMQEPASVLFSILNAAAHLYSIKQFRKYVIPKSPMYGVWHGYCMVAVNTWLWSTVFHMRDFEFTEQMDYICATTLVAYQLFSLFARLLVFKHTKYLIVLSAITALLCGQHVYRMLFIHFDYGYHVKVNVIIGILNAVGWIGWCIYSQKRQGYVWKAFTSIILVGLCLSLEVLDFPPLAWVLDAHSLWHAGTAPLTLLWYSFTIEDCNYLMKHGQQDIHNDKLESCKHTD